MTIPCIYIACLASYNNGILHGEWIDLDGSADLDEAIANIMQTSPVPGAEEWAVHDSGYCGQLSEYPGLDALKAIIDAYEQCENHHIDWEPFIAFCEYKGEDPASDQVQAFEEAYAGSNQSLESWCENFLEETGQLSAIPDNLRYYFNTQAYANDMAVNDVFTIEHDNDVLVFWRQ